MRRFFSFGRAHFLHLYWWFQGMITIKYKSTCLNISRRWERFIRNTFFRWFSFLARRCHKFRIIQFNFRRCKTFRKEIIKLSSALIVVDKAAIVWNLPPWLSLTDLWQSTHFYFWLYYLIYFSIRITIDFIWRSYIQVIDLIWISLGIQIFKYERIRTIEGQEELGQSQKYHHVQITSS